MNTSKALKKAVKQLGLSVLAEKLGVKRQTIEGWILRDSMPYTERLIGNDKTDYAKQIQIATGNKVTVKALLGVVPPHQAVEVMGVK